jgi:hypothetical protein
MKTLITGTLCLLVLFGQAQRRREANDEIWTAEQNAREMRRLDRERNNIYVHWEKNNRGEYEFFCDNNTFSDYTVV